jgi:hypothetical protein
MRMVVRRVLVCAPIARRDARGLACLSGWLVAFVLTLSRGASRP